MGILPTACDNGHFNNMSSYLTEVLSEYILKT